jgi:acylphosphatase
MNRVRVKVRIEGLVQGVFYRYSTQKKAEELNVRGWVRNVWDGSVECLFEGDQEKIETLITWCHKGPAGARVEKVTTEWEECKGDFEGFSIK